MLMLLYLPPVDIEAPHSTWHSARFGTTKQHGAAKYYWNSSKSETLRG